MHVPLPLQVAIGGVATVTTDSCATELIWGQTQYINMAGLTFGGGALAVGPGRGTVLGLGLTGRGWCCSRLGGGYMEGEGRCEILQLRSGGGAHQWSVVWGGRWWWGRTLARSSPAEIAASVDRQNVRTTSHPGTHKSFPSSLSPPFHPPPFLP